MRMEGVVLMAVASLPGAKASVRRELRRKGYKGDYEPTLARDCDIERRIGKDGTLNTKMLAALPNFYLDE